VSAGKVKKANKNRRLRELPLATPGPSHGILVRIRTLEFLILRRVLWGLIIASISWLVAAWVVLIKPKSWERHGLKPWIEAAQKRLHHNVLAIALANKLARIAWAVLNKERAFETLSQPV
jgi:hypothetical protein